MPRKYSGARGGDRLWPKVDIGENCWMWTGRPDKDGYGKLRTFEQRNVRAHVYAWWLATGTWPDAGAVIAHTCNSNYAPGDTTYRRCVRNDDIGTYEVDGITYERRGHLWLGTHPSNIRDRCLKGRSATGARAGLNTHPESRMYGDRNWTRQHPELVLRGDQNGAAKLSTAQVLEMRRLRDEGVAVKTLAAKFGVAVCTASGIVNKKTWTHL